MRAGNSCKKSLSLREFSVRVLWVFLMIGYLLSSAEAARIWDVTIVDIQYNVGRYSSLAVLPSGHPAISYYDWTLNDLKYAWYDGSMWQINRVESAGYVGAYSSLAILPSGQPAISYVDGLNDLLKYAWYDGNVWQTSTIAAVGSWGGHTSLAVLSSGHPAISYYNGSSDVVKYAWYDGTTWHTTTVDSVGSGGSYMITSLAILPSGQPAIGYYDGYPNGDLKYAWYDGSTWQITIVDDTLGYEAGYTSLAILPSGHPAISYYSNQNGGSLKYAWYEGSAWQTTTVDSEGDTGRYSSLVVLPWGYPAISYQAYAWEFAVLKYARYDGSTWETSTVDGTNRGRYSSLAVLPSGAPAISYHNWHSQDLMFARAPLPAPVGISPTYTAKASTDLGGTTVAIGGPAYNEGWGSGMHPAWASSSVSLQVTDGGHLQGFVHVAGTDGEDCFWDPELGEMCYPVSSCEDANGTVNGTIALGTSESYPAGSRLRLALQVLTHGTSGDAEGYHLKLWRGATLLGQIDPCAPEKIVVPALAGETLTFELFASEEDWSADWLQYDRWFEFRMILRLPVGDFDNDGYVDFRDYAIFALHWLDTGCVDPTWCGKTDLDKSTDVNWPDLKIFTDHWLE